MREYRLHLYRLLSILLPEMSCNSIKRGMLRWCGATVGKNCRICSSALISGSGNLTIGDEVYIGSKVVIRAAEGSSIHIGNYCDIAVNSCLCSATHSILSINADKRIAGPGIGKDIRIGDGCWLCAGSIIVAGTEIGQKCVVAANTVITQTFGDFLLLGGTPGKIIRYLKNEQN